MTSEHDLIVVGAGLSGLLAARHLKESVENVLVLDKGRGVGGRLSRRRFDGGVFDHGAQYFTVSDARFRNVADELIAAGVVRVWSTGFEDAAGHFKDNGEPRYVGVDGMSAVARFLARGLQVKTQHRVVEITGRDDGWRITTSEGVRFLSRALLLTAPVPQSLELLMSGGVYLPTDSLQALQRIQYERCLALMVELDGKSRIPPPGGKWLSGEPIAWIADNNQKGISAGKTTAVTIHAGPQFSLKHWDSAEEVVRDRLLSVAEPFLPGAPVHSQLHRWKFSLPTTLHRDRFLLIEQPAPLVFAGDAFGGPKVEGAALSGLSAGTALSRYLSPH